jgi:hypothetical protein
MPKRRDDVGLAFRKPIAELAGRSEDLLGGCEKRQSHLICAILDGPHTVALVSV